MPGPGPVESAQPTSSASRRLAMPTDGQKRDEGNPPEKEATGHSAVLVVTLKAHSPLRCDSGEPVRGSERMIT